MIHKSYTTSSLFIKKKIRSRQWDIGEYFELWVIVWTSKQFFVGECTLSVVNQYKYLGIILIEFVNFNVIADILSGAANRAHVAIISKYKHINGLGYYTNTKLYNSGVCLILDYCSEV